MEIRIKSGNVHDSLWAKKGYKPFIIALFLNAMTDLGHKIIIQNTVFKLYDGTEQIVLTAIVNMLILLPFIMIFSLSSYLSSRFSKTTVMQQSALLAIVVTSLITLSYFFWVV